MNPIHRGVVTDPSSRIFNDSAVPWTGFFGAWNWQWIVILWRPNGDLMVIFNGDLMPRGDLMVI